jgi:catechol 2,3-dioxygenase-like lactoylglutathione lyase family enzyme
MSLRHSPLMYVFYEMRQLDASRVLYESLIGLPVIEIEPHLPHHHHGVIKYDAGDIILSFNLSGPSRFPAASSDGLVTVFNVDPAWPTERLRDAKTTLTTQDEELYTDPQGHHYVFRKLPAESAGALAASARPRRPTVEELRLTVQDLDASIAYYRDILGLELLSQTEKTARFATGTVTLALERGELAPDGRVLAYNTYLIVFYCRDIEKMYSIMLKRGLEFKSNRVDYNEVGGTVRFDDPSGHRFCLYVPSEVSLKWESGPKVTEIAAAYALA